MTKMVIFGIIAEYEKEIIFRIFCYTMEKEKYLKIISATYKVIDFLPEAEPLKNRTKEKVLEIMDGLVSARNHGKILADIEVLESYIDLAKNQQWISVLNSAILLEQYNVLKNEIKNSAPKETVKEISSKPIIKKVVQPESRNQSNFTSRQQQILKALASAQLAQVADFKKIMPNVSKRTLRRDLDGLLKRGVIARVGKFNQVVYKIDPNWKASNPNGLGQGSFDRTNIMS